MRKRKSLQIRTLFLLAGFAASMLGCSSGQVTSKIPTPTVPSTPTTPSTPSTPSIPVLPPQQTRVVFDSRPNAIQNSFTQIITPQGSPDVYLMNPDGSGQVQLTNGGSTVHNREAACSPDGKQIYFVTRSYDPTTGVEGTAQLMVINADGSNPTRVTHVQDGMAHINVGPDGSLVYDSEFDGKIYVLKPGATSQIRLTDKTSKDGLPKFSPNGAKIVFVSDRDAPTDPFNTGGSKNRSIYLMNADGSGQTRLTNSSDDTDPAFSPDGKQIVFVSNRENPVGILDNYGSPQGATYQIFVMNADGSGQTRLLANATALEHFYIQLFYQKTPAVYDQQFQSTEQRPVFSPDGKQIVFLSNRNPDRVVTVNPVHSRHLYTMNTDGSNVTQITSGDTTDGDPWFSQR